VNLDTSKIDERQSIRILTPRNPNYQRMLCSDQFRVSRRSVPFAQELCLETLFLKESTNRRYRVLVSAIPVFPEIICLEKLFYLGNPFRLHRGHTFYLQV
jgi:hypothetical protein